MIGNIFTKAGLGSYITKLTNNLTFSNNTINSKKILLLINEPNISLPENIGQFLLLNSSNEIITNQNLTSIIAFESNNIVVSYDIIRSNLQFSYVVNVTLNNSLFPPESVNGFSRINLWNINNSNLDKNIIYSDIF